MIRLRVQDEEEEGVYVHIFNTLDPINRNRSEGITMV